MPDTPAERARRRRSHVKGDHSLCHPGRCPNAGRQTDPDEPEFVEEPFPSASSVRESLREFTAAMQLKPGDVRTVLVQCAYKLAEALDRADPRNAPALARELRTVLHHIEDVDDDGDQVDWVRARRALKAAEMLLSGPLPGGEAP